MEDSYIHNIRKKNISLLMEETGCNGELAIEALNKTSDLFKALLYVYKNATYSIRRIDSKLLRVSKN